MASPTTAAAAEVDEDNDFWMAEADAAALEAALDAYRYECAQDDPSLLELLEAPLEAGKAKAKGSGAKSAKVQGSWVTMQQRNIRFMHFFMPILKGYRRMQLLVAKMRKKDKPKDPNAAAPRRPARESPARESPARESPSPRPSPVSASQEPARRVA